jgi:hypothetical protein
MDAGLAADHPVTVATKMLRLELLKTKAELEGRLGEFVLDCTKCGQEVRWVQGMSMADLRALGGTASRHRMRSQRSKDANQRLLSRAPRTSGIQHSCWGSRESG